MTTMKKITNLSLSAATAVLIAGAVSGCDGLLDVQDPQRFTSGDLDSALEAVAAGVEGDLHAVVDGFVTSQELLGDVFQHTGTWANYDDIDHGRISYSNSVTGDPIMVSLLRTRWFADDARARIDRVLEGEAAASPLSAQVETVSAISDLLVGMMFCEAPAEAAGPAVDNMQILQQAANKFTTSLTTAQAAGADDWALASYAGRARANLYLGNYDQALADAGQIPDGWVKVAQFSQNSGRQNNSIVTLLTAGFNRAAGLRGKWWASVDNDAKMMRDPFTQELDSRLSAWFDGTIATDGVTDHYSQYKYQQEESDIPLFDAQEMRLIEAEVFWQRGDLDQALATLNALRVAANLAPHAATTDPALVKEYLLHERFAETFMEGHRVTDLRRLGELRNVFAAMNDPERPATRPAVFPMDDGEARDNPNIEDNAAQRCLPMT